VLFTFYFLWDCLKSSKHLYKPFAIVSHCFAFLFGASGGHKSLNLLMQSLANHAGNYRSTACTIGSKDLLRLTMLLRNAALGSGSVPACFARDCIRRVHLGIKCYFMCFALAVKRMFVMGILMFNVQLDI